MEGEQRHYELRSNSRSRSQTPLVQNRSMLESEVVEHHYDLRSRSRERSHTPAEVTSSRKSGSRSLPGSGTKTRDHSMETITERKEEMIIESNMEGQNKKFDSATSTATRKAERRSERQKARRQIFVNGQNESKEGSVERKSEQKRKSVTPRRVLTSDYSSEEGEREDPPSRPGSAYEIYKQAGEWWNVFPKTDYTYSQKSQFRYEIAPGVLAMPNMSRRSIHSDGSSTISSVPSISQNLSQISQITAESGLGDTVDTVDLKESSDHNQTSLDNSYELLHKRSSDSRARSVLYKKTHVEHYKSHREVIYTEPENVSDIRQRYFSWSNTPSRYVSSHTYGGTSQIDSDTELDEAVPLTTIKHNQRWKVTQWLQSFITLITVWFSKVLEFLKVRTVKRREYATYDYRPYQESKWSKLWWFVDRPMQYVYFLIVKLFLFNAWLLSRVLGVKDRVQNSGRKILWLTLFPLLLLAGFWCLPNLLSYLPITKTAMNEVREEIPLPNLQYRNTPKISLEDDSVKSVIERLNNRIKRLENANTYQMEYLQNISSALEEFKENDSNIWKRYNNKIINMEERLTELRELYFEYKSCCDMRPGILQSKDIESHVEKILTEYFGATVSKKDVNKVIQNLITSSNKQDDIKLNSQSAGEQDMTDEHVREIVKEMLNIYNADKTGRVDYALEPAGGQIISTRCTQMYDLKSRAFKVLGLTLYYESNNPRTVIQGNPIQPGVCWAFQDFPGYLLIKLRSFIYVTGFTIEHAPRLILPNGEMKSAPRRFNVWGLNSENDLSPVLFGDYEFTNSDENLQYFPVQNEINTPFEYVELRVHSNHGQLEYTCLYRFRVHGRVIETRDG